jgi:hypothetical protein
MKTLAANVHIEGDDPAWRERVRRAIAAIDAAHCLPGGIGGVNVLLVPDELGEQSGHPVLGSYQSGGFVKLPAAAPEWVIVHEIAHWLSEAWAHRDGQDDVIWLLTSDEAGPWSDTMFDTSLFSRVWGRCSLIDRSIVCGDRQAVSYLRYLARTRELWARSYTQWVLAQSPLCEQVSAYSQLTAARQLGEIAHWPVEDAARLALAFERMLAPVAVAGAVAA